MDIYQYFDNCMLWHNHNGIMSIKNVCPTNSEKRTLVGQNYQEKMIHENYTKNGLTVRPG